MLQVDNLRDRLLESQAVYGSDRVYISPLHTPDSAVAAGLRGSVRTFGTKWLSDLGTYNGSSRNMYRGRVAGGPEVIAKEQDLDDIFERTIDEIIAAQALRPIIAAACDPEVFADLLGDEAPLSFSSEIPVGLIHRLKTGPSDSDRAFTLFEWESGETVNALELRSNPRDSRWGYSSNQLLDVTRRASNSVRQALSPLGITWGDLAPGQIMLSRPDSRLRVHFVDFEACSFDSV